MIGSVLRHSSGRIVNSVSIHLGERSIAGRAFAKTQSLGRDIRLFVATTSQCTPLWSCGFWGGPAVYGSTRRFGHYRRVHQQHHNGRKEEKKNSHFPLRAVRVVIPEKWKVLRGSFLLSFFLSLFSHMFNSAEIRQLLI